MRVSGIELCIGLLTLSSAAYFHGGAASNQNARLDAAFAFVEPGLMQGTFRIDRFMIAPEREINTADWARAHGHYFANKAPGTLVLSAIAYSVIYALESAMHLDPTVARLQIINSYLINVCVSASWFAVAAVLAYRLLRTRLPPLPAAALSSAWCLGTGLFPYATQLWGHTTTAAFVLAGIYQFRIGASARWAAFWLGAAVATDYLASVAALGLALTHVYVRPKDLPHLLVGALPAVAFMLGYQWYCFGSPWLLSTSVSNPAYIDHKLVLGMFAVPKLAAWWQLSFGLRRGLFVQMPLLLLTFVGFGHWFRRAPRDPWLWASAATLVAASLVVAGFNGWHGGSTVCARYLLPFLPLTLLPLSELPLPWMRRWAWPTAALAAGSMFNMLTVAAVNPLCPDEHANPLYGYTYQMFFAGNVSPYAFPVRLLQYDPQWPVLRQWAMWNWGEVLGLRGMSSIVPLLAAWAIAATIIAQLAINTSAAARLVGEDVRLSDVG